MRIARTPRLFALVAALIVMAIVAIGCQPVRPGPVGAPRLGWTQSAMEAWVRFWGLSPYEAHVFGAIAMGETGGWNFPTCNPTGCYHGPWAFQEAWAIPAGLNMWRLDHELQYASLQTVLLFRRAGWQPWYGDSPQTGGNFQRFM
jgi:hypothetical protein